MNAADKIRKALDKAGIPYSTHYAETGSQYIHVGSKDRSCADAAVRVSDHDECYPPESGERRLEVVGGHGVDEVIAALLAPEFPANIEPYIVRRPRGNAEEMTVEMAQAECASIPSDVIEAAKSLSNAKRNAVAKKYGVNPRALWAMTRKY